MSGQHCENCDVKGETIHWDLSAFVFHQFEPVVLLYNKSLNDWSLGEQWILFSSILGKQNLLFPSGPVIKC